MTIKSRVRAALVALGIAIVGVAAACEYECAIDNACMYFTGETRIEMARCSTSTGARSATLRGWCRTRIALGRPQAGGVPARPISGFCDQAAALTCRIRQRSARSRRTGSPSGS